jgi:hypothetical protein
MSVPSSLKPRANVWLEGLGDWAWPGSRAQPEPLPPPWVPASPRRVALATAGAAAGAARVPAQPARVGSRRPLALTAGVLLAAACAAAALGARPALERIVANVRSVPASGLAREAPAPRAVAPDVSVSFAGVAPTGSTIDAAQYRSAALHGRGSFIVYLPPSFSFAGARFPVLYLLHGDEQRASAFLDLGLQSTLDRLIGEHAIPPLIAVMIQGGRGPNNWRDEGARRYERYVLEVQQLVDRMYPTLAERDARAIAGDSMGGYGAMNVALGHPERFGVVESWLGFFNGLGGELHAARATIARAGLHAFIYGGASDTIADPSENAPFAAAMRAAGADAASAVYAGAHTLETLKAHFTHALRFAGSSLALAPGLRALARPAR